MIRAGPQSAKAPRAGEDLRATPTRGFHGDQLDSLLAWYRRVPLMAAYYACMIGNDLVPHPWATRSKRGFDAQLVIVPLDNVACLGAFVLVPNDPRTPLWTALQLYAGATASWQ